MNAQTTAKNQHLLMLLALTVMCAASLIVCLVAAPQQAHADKVKQKGSSYVYLTSKGKPAKKGYHIKGGKLYHVESKKGVLTCGKRFEGITFTKQGYAKDNTASRLKIATMRRVAKLTNSSMTRKQKLRRCFSYAISRPFVNSTEPRDIGTPGWVQRCALRALTTGRTECIGFACSFAMMAYELGYQPTVYAQAYVHGWVRLEGHGAYDNMHGGIFGGSPQHEFRNFKHWRVVNWSTLSPRGTSKSKQRSLPKINGLKKENGKYYYYVGGERLKSEWVTIKNKKYYFSKNGTAFTSSSHKLKVSNNSAKKAWFVFDKKGRLLTGRKTRLVKVGKTTYLVKANGRAKSGTYKGGKYLKNGEALTGIRLTGKKLTAYKANGQVNSKLTKKLRKATKVDKDATKLLELLGKPAKKTKSVSCYPRVEVAGHDWNYTYDHIKVETFHADDGSMHILEGVYKL